jgi:hypothetical protein
MIESLNIINYKCARVDYIMRLEQNEGLKQTSYGHTCTLVGSLLQEIGYGSSEKQLAEYFLK